ncbi:hypothetical protein QBC35DRAFT_389761 [Podospora australis]|uniref:SET domain-containing protein n=1 Tax=Podospora australis TaxID=1536484 RepID=A0AAN6WNN9_9PEZI|nr:hypothetical protein QBC35DRAFT_389761 [Podospora australis]
MTPLNTFTNSRPALPTCPISRVKPSPPEPGPGPWTHAPYCVVTSRTSDKKLCVFTDANYNHGKGLSIVAKREVAESFVSEGLLPGSSSPSPTHPEPKYEVIPKPNQGLGLFVKPSPSYLPGETILLDHPTLIFPSSDSTKAISLETLSNLRRKALLQLPPQTRSLTRSLAQSIHSGKKRVVDEITDIIQTNAFTQQKAGATHDLIFPLAARINHACTPNAFTRTNISSLAMEVIALTEILPGEEIVHSYLDPSLPLSFRERQQRFHAGWNFRCRCTLCTAPKENIAASDAQRKKIAELREQLEDDETKGDAAAILKIAQRLLELYEAEGMVMPQAEANALAAYGCKYLAESGNEQQWKKAGRKYAKEAARLYGIMFGEESQEVEEMVMLGKDLS